jgi:hypothetical protein
VHLEWVVLQVNVANAFNTISHKVIFKKIQRTNGQLAKLSPIVQTFYAT